MIINHRGNRFKGLYSLKTATKLVAKRDKIDLGEKKFELDHIIPYCISKNSELSNLQLLDKNEHRRKTIIDLKVLKILRGEGYYEKITHYSIELLKKQSEVIARFIKLREELIGLIGLIE